MGSRQLPMEMKISSEPVQREKKTRAGFRLTARDAAICQAVAEYRALTSPQIEKLLFPSATPKSGLKINPRCQSRLQHLFRLGYLTREEQPQKLSEGRLPY